MNISAAKPSGIGLVSFQVIDADSASAWSPDNPGTEAQEITPSKGSRALLPPGLGRAPRSPAFVLPLPKHLQFPCPPTATITRAAFSLGGLLLTSNSSHAVTKPAAVTPNRANEPLSCGIKGERVMGRPLPRRPHLPGPLLASPPWNLLGHLASTRPPVSGGTGRNKWGRPGPNGSSFLKSRFFF